MKARTRSSQIYDGRSQDGWVVYNDIPTSWFQSWPTTQGQQSFAKCGWDGNCYELLPRWSSNIAGLNAKVEEFNLPVWGWSRFHYHSLLWLWWVGWLLMMVASKEVEDAIIRRIEGARWDSWFQIPAHPLMSFGLIKANVHLCGVCFIWYRLRTIWWKWSRKLLCQGDMLFKPIDENHPVRSQGLYLGWWCWTYRKLTGAQADADYDESFDPGEVSEMKVNFQMVNLWDPLFWGPRLLVIETQKVSASMIIQRRLSAIIFNPCDLSHEELEMQVLSSWRYQTKKSIAAINSLCHLYWVCLIKDKMERDNLLEFIDKATILDGFFHTIVNRNLVNSNTTSKKHEINLNFSINLFILFPIYYISRWNGFRVFFRYRRFHSWWMFVFFNVQL